MDTQQNESLPDLWTERNRLRSGSDKALTASRKPGDADEERGQALHDQYWEIERRIVDANPANPEDLAVQARLLRYYVEVKSTWKDDVDHTLARKIVAAFERMTKARTARDELFDMDDTITTLVCIASLLTNLTEPSPDMGLTWLSGELSGAVHTLDEQWKAAADARGIKDA